MNMHAATLDRIAKQAPTMTEAQRNWRIAAIALLSIRVIQGFIYWGGGSRRFIYAPSKLDPSAPSWMANKFQTAMPGALFGTDHLISFLLTHFYLLYAGVILFSAAELIVGAMLMTGLLTRLAALFSMSFSVLLMAMFGWQGATCIDEWSHDRTGKGLHFHRVSEEISQGSSSQWLAQRGIGRLTLVLHSVRHRCYGRARRVADISRRKRV